MATITWRNVDAPDFRGVQNSMNSATAMLQGAATGWNRNLLDEEELARSGLQRDNLTQQMGQQAYLNDRLRTGNAAMDAASPAMRQLALASRTGDQIGMEAALRDPAMQGLRGEQFMGATEDAGKLLSSSLGNDVTRQGLTERRDTFDQTLAGRQRLANVTAAVSNVMQNALSPADAEVQMNKQLEGMSPEEQLMFRGEVARRFPGSTVASSGAGGNALLTQAAQANGLPIPSTGSRLAPTNNPLMDSFVNGLAKLETAGGTKTIKSGGKDSNNLFNIKDFSGTGSGFQATDKAEGSNDRYRVYGSPEESRADLMDLLSRKYPAALMAKTPEEFAKALKDGGYATDPDYVKKLTNAIGSTTGTPAVAGATGVTSGPTTGGDRAAALMQTAAQSEMLNSGITSDYMAALKSTEPVTAVADRLRKDTLVGWSDKQTMDKIQEVQKMVPGMNPAQAAAVITRSLEGASSDPFQWGSPSTWGAAFLNTKRQIDKSSLQVNIDALKGGATDRSLLNAQQTQENAETLSAASKAASDASSVLRTYQKKIDAGQTGLEQYMPKLRQDLLDANKLYDTLSKAQQADSTQNSARYAELQRQALEAAAKKNPTDVNQQGQNQKEIPKDMRTEAEIRLDRAARAKATNDRVLGRSSPPRTTTEVLTGDINFR